MPCGCSKGKWTPNTAAAQATASQNVAKAKGPHAPGYTAPEHAPAAAPAK